MNFTQEQISEILLQIANQKEGYKLLMTMTLDALMKSERSLHNSEVSDVSNGFRPRRVFGNGKVLELRIPRSRSGAFYPALLGILKDQQEEAQSLVYQLYTSGLTTIQIGDIFEQIYGKHYSTSQVSYLMNDAREEVSMWLNRSIESYYPIIYIDATYVFTRREENVSKEAYYTILGVKNDKTREVLAIVNSPTESATIWQEALLDLKKRGLETVGLVVSDGLSGIDSVIKGVFPSAAHQLCTVHLKRNILAKIKSCDKDSVAQELKIVFNPDNKEDNAAKGRERFTDFIDKWVQKYPSLKNYKDPIYALYFTYLNYDISIRRMIYTTNWIERLNRNYKRTLKMRTALPSAQSVIFLMGATARNQKAYDYPIANFNDEKNLFKN